MDKNEDAAVVNAPVAGPDGRPNQRPNTVTGCSWPSSYHLGSVTHFSIREAVRIVAGTA